MIGSTDRRLLFPHDWGRRLTIVSRGRACIYSRLLRLSLILSKKCGFTTLSTLECAIYWAQSFWQCARVSASCSAKVFEKYVLPSSPATKNSQSVSAGCATAVKDVSVTLLIGPIGNPLTL